MLGEPLGPTPFEKEIEKGSQHYGRTLKNFKSKSSELCPIKDLCISDIESLGSTTRELFSYVIINYELRVTY